MDEGFRSEMAAGYGLKEPAIVLGSPMLGAELVQDVRVQAPLAMMNRHGLIAGATGTGKTKTLQLLAGELSDAGVPVFIADIKGDLTGLGAAGDATNAKVQERCASIGWTFAAKAHPIELFSLSGKLGAQLRATVHSFGPLLLGKVLDLNPTQTSILSIVFKYCDDNKLPLLDLEDLATTLKFLGSDDGKAVLDEYGGMSKASLGVLLRSIVTFQQEGSDIFFGEPEFDVADLMRLAPDGTGVISLLELSDVMTKPRLFSTFMLWLLAQLYSRLPEAGDLPKPKLAFFFDEAHLLFDDASSALLDQVEQTVRLIRSKGVGVFFVTQNPTDVPASVLAQLGNRVEHALRAFTPEDADAIRKTARTFPITTHYNVEETLTSLGIGEAFVTVLSPRGIPTPLAATRLLPPDSMMSPLDPVTLEARRVGGTLAAKYGTPIDRQSAHEIITARIEQARAVAVAAAPAGAGSLDGMTPAQQRREIERQVREEARQREADRKAAERDRREAERDAKAAERERIAAARAAQRERDQMIRTATRVATSKAGQDVLRSVFGTLFGGSSGRRR